MKIGLVGTGRMGKAIVLRLLDKGYPVTVWNRTTDKLKDLQTAGATLAQTPAALARGSDVVISILTNAEAQQAVFDTPVSGMLATDLRGKLFIEMSTVRPESSRALEKKVEALGGQFVESPVGGTTGPAREGKLLAFVGAKPDAFAAALPLLHDLCRRVEHVGPVGAGSSLKLAVNLPLLVFWQAFGEALSLVSHLTVPPERLIDILSDTSGAPVALKARAPQFVARLQGQPPPNASFDLFSILKDLQTMRAEAEGVGIKVPVVTAAIQAYEDAVRAGLGHSDSIEQSLYWQSKTKKFYVN